MIGFHPWVGSRRNIVFPLFSEHVGSQAFTIVGYYITKSSWCPVRTITSLTHCSSGLFRAGRSWFCSQSGLKKTLHRSSRCQSAETEMFEEGTNWRTGDDVQLSGPVKVVLTAAVPPSLVNCIRGMIEEAGGSTAPHHPVITPGSHIYYSPKRQM